MITVSELPEEWSLLDDAAKANLSDSKFPEFQAYKLMLYQAGEAWRDAEEILRGYIWGEIE